MNYVFDVESGAVNAHQQFELQVNGAVYDLRLDYIEQAGSWTLSVIQDGERLADGVMLYGGANLFSAFPKLTNTARLYVVGDEPTLDNLGVTNSIVWESLLEEVS